MLYSSETWCTYRLQENRLNAFHFRCLRSILGVSWRDHVPNSTMLHRTGSYDLTTIIRQRRLHWLGHVHRMEDGCLPKDILYSEFYNAPCRTGRPKLRYKDVIKRDMAGFHISPQSWETLAADLNRWRASLSFGYSLSATSYAKKMEKRRAHHRQRRDGPWWWWNNLLHKPKTHLITPIFEHICLKLGEKALWLTLLCLAFDSFTLYYAAELVLNSIVSSHTAYVCHNW